MARLIKKGFFKVSNKIGGLINLIRKKPREATGYSEWAYNFHTQMDDLIDNFEREDGTFGTFGKLRKLVRIIFEGGEGIYFLLDQKQTTALSSILGNNSELNELLHIYQDLDEQVRQGLWDQLHGQMHYETMDVVQKNPKYMWAMGVSIERITNAFTVSDRGNDAKCMERICKAFQTDLEAVKDTGFGLEGQGSDYLLCMLLIERSQKTEGEFPFAFLPKLHWVIDTIHKIKGLQDKSINETLGDTLQKVGEFGYFKAKHIDEYSKKQKYCRQQIETLTKLGKYGFDDDQEEKAVEISNIIFLNAKVWALHFPKECVRFLQQRASGFTDYLQDRSQFDDLLAAGDLKQCQNFIIGKQTGILGLCAPYVTEPLKVAMSEERWTDENIKQYFAEHGSPQALASRWGYPSCLCFEIESKLCEDKGTTNPIIFPIVLQVMWVRKLWECLHEKQQPQKRLGARVSCAFCNTPKPFK